MVMLLTNDNVFRICSACFGLYDETPIAAAAELANPGLKKFSMETCESSSGSV